jgi:hypothetical protein
MDPLLVSGLREAKALLDDGIFSQVRAGETVQASRCCGSMVLWEHLWAAGLTARQEDFDREKERLVRDREQRDRTTSAAGRPGAGHAGTGLAASPPPLEDYSVDEFVAGSDDLYSTRDGLDGRSDCGGATCVPEAKLRASSAALK